VARIAEADSKKIFTLETQSKEQTCYGKGKQKNAVTFSLKGADLNEYEQKKLLKLLKDNKDIFFKRFTRLRKNKLTNTCHRNRKQSPCKNPIL
jgi:hypothetical protein